MFTPDQSDFRLTELMRRLTQPSIPWADPAAELRQARADIDQLLVLVDELDEQLTDALHGNWADE